MKWFVPGATGLLGAAAVRVLKDRGEVVIGAARSNADHDLDISDPDALRQMLDTIDPDVVFNCAANASIGDCEENPLEGYNVNARAVTAMANWSRETGRPLVHVSTDHFFDEGGPYAHPETDRPVVFNEYAATKLASETFALTAEHALVLRTNLAGAQRGFARWVIDTLLERNDLTVFVDVYCSTIHVDHFVEATVELVNAEATGLFNLGSRDVFSKAEFIYAVADELGIDLDWAKVGSALSISPRRARSLGMDVSRTEAVLGRRLPTLSETVQALVEEYRACATTPNSPSATG